VTLVDDTPERLVGKPSWLITQLATHVRRLVTEAFTDADARGYHYRILAALREFGVASQIELARRCGMDRSDVVAAVNELVAREHVDRTSDPDDRRRNLVTITKEGERQLRRLDQALHKVQGELLAPLSAQERLALFRMLTMLLRHQEE
jgi:DNA-binding MarR family transcriptional regulator